MWFEFLGELGAFLAGLAAATSVSLAQFKKKLIPDGGGFHVPWKVNNINGVVTPVPPNGLRTTQ
ncbi:hypothetical protein [uncultured Roseobacter sp.]|uniref:hypothetical protein n=1 Tax=uncultured Roseobacter sp. TaxID=114847 RepID=UPI00261DFA98|nr:hypothetical protein [uncultured Roseobacter sp.]